MNDLDTVYKGLRALEKNFYSMQDMSREETQVLMYEAFNALAKLRS